MKLQSVRKILVPIVILAAIIATASMNGCVTPQSITDKSGAQLWGENCRRCHNIPDPKAFSDEQWETIGLHMKTRAVLTENETKKIVQFLQSAN